MRIFSYSEHADKGYSKIEWLITAGAIDMNFYKYLFLSNHTLLGYFRKNWSFMYDSANKIDGAHFAATLNTYYQWKVITLSKFGDITKPYTIKSLPNMAGWAGDFHTFMAKRIRKINGDTTSDILMYLPDCKSYEKAKDATKNFMGHKNSSMSKPDIFADVDAANLAFLNYIYGYTLDKSILGYYQWGSQSIIPTNTYLYRYDNFIRSIIALSYIKPYNKKTEKQDFKDIIKLYTNKIEGKEWPIYAKNKIKAHVLDEKQRAGITDGFYEFIFERTILK